ncbi:MAG: alpha/beta hydrolase, partial [Hyphomonadaceae bacterium]|nr:alpha/beta hydrolase [Hyphomonadaceae bacterium]
RVTFADDIVGIVDVTYIQRLHHRPLTLDIYTTADALAGARRPLIIYVHGGAWVTGTPRQMPSVLAMLAAQGFVVASIEYRLDGEQHFPNAIHDVKDAIRFLRANAREYGVDPDHVGIWGDSAGGQLAALATLSCGAEAVAPPSREGMETISDCVQAGVSWYGVHDFSTVPTPPGNTGPAPYLGCAEFRCPAEVMARASPVTYVDRSDPPMLLIHGLADTLVAVSQTEELEARLRTAGADVEAIYIADVDHGFRGMTPEITRSARNQALNATLRFFQMRLVIH